MIESKEDEIREYNVVIKEIEWKTLWLDWDVRVRKIQWRHSVKKKKEKIIEKTSMHKLELDKIRLLKALQKTILRMQRVEKGMRE